MTALNVITVRAYCCLLSSVGPQSMSRTVAHESTRLPARLPACVPWQSKRMAQARMCCDIVCSRNTEKADVEKDGWVLLFYGVLCTVRLKLPVSASSASLDCGIVGRYVVATAGRQAALEHCWKVINIAIRFICVYVVVFVGSLWKLKKCSLNIGNYNNSNM